MANKIYIKDWVKQYQPHCDEFGELIDYLDAYQMSPTHKTWTELDSGQIVPGRRFANRFAYYVTEVAWQEEDEHTLEVTDLISREDYLAEIKYRRDEGDEDTVETLQIQMEEEFGDGE